jgi:hypothetical protein
MSKAVESLEGKLNEAKKNLEQCEGYHSKLNEMVNEARKSLLSAQIAVAAFTAALEELNKALAEEDNA